MKLVLVSTFWNAGNHVKNCINSLKNQYYTNFTSYFVDDMSTDNSYEIAKETIGDDPRFVLIKNTSKKFKTKNFIDIIRENPKIDWDDVIIEIDGDDQLADNFVLGRLNKIFMDRNIWLCGTKWKDKYGNLGNYGKPNPERARSTPWNFSHMRSFRAFLFRQIKDEHLKMDGQYFKGACDIGHAIPMLEMSGSEHFYYINEPLYIYTWHDKQSYSEKGGIGNKLTQAKTGGYIYRLPKYKKLIIHGSEEEYLYYENKLNNEKIKNEKIQSIKTESPKEKPKIDIESLYSLINKNQNTNKTKPRTFFPKEQTTRQNKPSKREELIQLKKDSIAKQVRVITSVKPNRRNNLPNIF